jgi:hypothetical protein
MTQQRPHVRRMMLHPGEALDHDGDTVQRPQLPSEPVGGGAFQQGLLDSRELGVRQPGCRAARPAAAQRFGPAGLEAAIQTLTA